MSASHKLLRRYEEGSFESRCWLLRGSKTEAAAGELAAAKRMMRVKTNVCNYANYIFVVAI
jgi:hypothetical protein